MTVEKVGRPVVVGVDGSEGADSAVRWGARYASETGSPLHLMFAAGHPTGVIGVSTGEVELAERLRDRVLSTAAAAAAPYEADVVLVRGAAVRTLTAATAEADLLVLGESHRRSGLAVQIVAEAECPVVVVRGDDDWAAPIVVAVDDGSEAAMGFAVREAARRGVALFAVHAWQQPLVPSGAGALAVAGSTGVVDRQDWADAARRSLSEAVAPWRSAFPEVAIHERLIEGPAEGVVTHETAGAGLVVAGSRGRGRLAGMLLGSTSQALLRHADCPVAVVKS
ncbi:universal stress protein [Actinoplanes sp. TRM 88003]|uniref:Universal stress protein n=1 Tax=Paractinoplanes aksuensis TaxID=2939490 RepID=A0ABT1DEV0_9ACTN|nr:universal stress protein [Actinoplanes aksuensis]MCO8269008.1 universal stress protein [Actinoplanes aksuensis]